MNTNALADSQVVSPKYINPKILLMNMDAQVEDRLKLDGFNIASGSFGTPFKIKKTSSLVQLSTNGHIPPHIKEKHIFVVDIKINSTDGSAGEPYSTPEDKDWWVSCKQGLIDPRPRLMCIYKDDIDLIVNSGGICIIFAAPAYDQELMWSTSHELRYGHSHNAPSPLEYNNWSFLSELNSLQIRESEGEEIFVEGRGEIFSNSFWDYVSGANFNCFFEPDYRIKNRWLTLATDKFGKPVCGVIAPEKDQEKQGHIFIFPRIENKAEFLSDFLKNVLPNVSPQLFPEFEGAGWIHNSTYELPHIQQIQSNIGQVEEEVRKKIEALNKDIEEAKIENAFLYNLLSGTGDAFVDAVQKTLKMFGFEQVIDVDKVVEAEGVTQRDEDLQILDTSPSLLIEAKGIGGMPSDDDILAVEKYLVSRMKEWRRTDVSGLSIINHQRNLPGLDRHEHPFRSKIVGHAEARDLGLLTGWDLYRLARGFLKNKWSADNIKPLFYQSGRIEALPFHYEYIGTIEGFIEKIQVVGIKIEQGEIHPGDTIAFELPIDFEEQIVEGLQSDNMVVSEGKAGMIVGIKTHLSKTQAKEKRRVFRVGFGTRR